LNPKRFVRTIDLLESEFNMDTTPVSVVSFLSDEALLDEAELRGLIPIVSDDVNDLVNTIYENQKLGKDIQPLLILLYDTVLGRVA